MRWGIIALFIAAAFLLACTPQQNTDEKGYAVGVYNLTESHKVIDGTEKDIFKFHLENQESFPLDCQILMIVDHPEEGFKKKGNLGTIGPGEKKPAAFTVELPSGEYSINWKPICTK